MDLLKLSTKKHFSYKRFMFLTIFVLFCSVQGVNAQTPAPGHPVYIYLFWGDGCPHCAKAKPYFENLAAVHPEVVLKTYEIYYDQGNQKLFTQMAEKFGVEQLAVPTIFIGPYFLQGYSEELDSNIESVVVQCIKDGCVDAGLGLMTTAVLATPTLVPTLAVTQAPTITSTEIQVSADSGSQPSQPSGNLNQSHRLVIPILGTVNLDSQSALLSTILIALVDGFNPCSLWVLTMLLVLTLHTGSRKKVFLIGMVFLTVTAGIYALFIIGLFSVLKIASFMTWIRILVALVALLFAVVNIKDYFWYKEGLSFTIADTKKPGIFKKMRAVIDASQSFWGIIGATVVLAAGVSLVEFSCTAGFPVVWTNIINTQNIDGVAFIALLLIYMLIYQLDELVVFASSVITLKASRVEEKHGRILKLISGILMFTLSTVMLINPSLMNNLSSSLIIFGISFLITLVVLFFHQYLLPKFGIFIGSGQTEPGKSAKNSK